jgi:hypothetical protein
LTVKPAFAQSEIKPSAPQFTLKLDNSTLEFTIKNQTFTPFYDSSGNYIDLYYNFRCKQHYGDQWTNYPFAETGQGTLKSVNGYTVMYGSLSPEYPASNSQYTTVSASLWFFDLQSLNASQEDFQVQALIGHIDPIVLSYETDFGYYVFTGQSSDWSNTQTITQPSSSPSPTSTPTVPEFPMIAIPLFLSLLSAAAILILKKQKNML